MSILDSTSLSQKPEAEPQFANIFGVTSINPALDRANASLSNSVDANPDQAAQAIPMAQDLGLSPKAVDSDFEVFSKKHGLAQAAQIVGESPQLVNYINSNPMAAKVSKDDYPQLNDVSKAMDAVGTKSFSENFSDVIHGVWNAYKEGPEGYKELAEGYNRTLISLGVDPAVADVQTKAFSARAFRNEDFTNALFSVGMVLASPAIAAFRTYLAQPIERKTGFPAETTEALTIAGLGFLGMKGSLKDAGKIQQTVKTSEPFVSSGKPVPVGADEVTDKVHIEQAKADKKALAELTKAVDKSLTRERAPEMFEDFLKQHPSGEIGVPVDEILKLYGDKVPAPDDGVLGGVPGIQEQLQTAATTRGDVKIPLSSWLAKVEPEVRKELEDHVRFRDGGVTVEEGKAGIEVFHGSPYSFDAFSSEAIGTGEAGVKGAPGSYGFGHYFAEERKVAEDYAKNLSLEDNPQHAAWQIMQMDFVKGNRETAAKSLEADIAALEPGEKDSFGHSKESLQKAVEILRSKEEIKRVEPQGQMYKARILRRPEEFLDWDKPLSEQGIDFEKINEAVAPNQPALPEMTGEQVMTALRNMGKTPEQSSKLLSDAGIAGIKYLDQESRIARDSTTPGNERPDAPKLTSNFVVFRDQDIEVLERNGEAVEALRRASGLQPKLIDYTKPKVAPDITKAVYEKYTKLLIEQRDSDRAYYEKKALDAAKRTQTKTWKENEIALRREVVAGLRAEPSFAAESFFRDGQIGDQNVERPKIGTGYLSEEEIAALPKDFVRKDGMTPDEAAAFTGHRSGRELLDDLARWEALRKQSNMRPMDFRRRMVDAEIERQMEVRYGKLSENIIEDAKKQVLSRIEEDKLQEEAVIEAIEGGADYKEVRAQLEQSRAAAIEAFENSPVKNAKSDAYLANIGRLDRGLEGSMLKDDVRDAFAQRERKFIAAVLGRRSIEIEDLGRDLVKTAKKYTGRDLPKVERVTVNYVRSLLDAAGYPLKVTTEEINRAIQEEGYSSFQDYVATKAGYGWEPDVSGRIVQNGPGKLENMTVAEFREFSNAIQSLDEIGRKENQVIIRGNAMDMAEFEKEVEANLKLRPIRDAEETAKGGRWLWGLDAPLTRMEEIVKDIDMRKELGPLYNAIIMPYEMAKAESYSTLEKLSKQMVALKAKGFDEKWYNSLSQEVPQDFIHDSWNNQTFKMTKWNVIKLALNMGNKGNMKTLIDGIARAQMDTKGKPTPEHLALVEGQVRGLIDKALTKKDLDFVQHMWDLAGQYKDRIYALNYATGGKEVKFIEPQEFQTAQGTLKGGYFPLIPDRLRSFQTGAKRAPEIDGPLGKDYFRANTSQTHLEARTGASYFVDLTGGPEQLIGRLQQVVHDLAYREFAIDAGKVIYNPRIKNMIQKYYGVEYEKLMEPWLKRVVNQANVPEVELGKWNNLLRQFRMNLIAYALPLNYAVTFSTSLGTANLKTFAEFNANRAMNKKMVMDNSKELQHTMYSLDRDVQEALNRVFNKGKYTSFQIRAMEQMFKPMVWLEQQARMNTFYGEFVKQKAAGLSDFEASVLGDSLIRERHGAASVGDLPSLMANPNEFVKIATVFMGYFNSQRNWMRQIPHAAREGDWGTVGKVLWGTVAINAMVNAALFERRRKDDTFFSFMGRATMSTPLSMVPYVRDAWTYYTQGYRPTASVLSAIMAAGDLLKDGYNITKRKPLKHAVKDVAAAAGQLGGAPGTLQIGRTGQFLSDVSRGQSHPHGFVEWVRGLFTGKAQLEK